MEIMELIRATKAAMPRVKNGRDQRDADSSSTGAVTPIPQLTPAIGL